MKPCKKLTHKTLMKMLDNAQWALDRAWDDMVSVNIIKYTKIRQRLLQALGNNIPFTNTLRDKAT